MTADTLTREAARWSGPGPPSEPDVQLRSAGVYQANQHRSRRLAGTGLMGAHHTLGHPRPATQLYLGQSGPAARLPRQLGSSTHGTRLWGILWCQERHSAAHSRSWDLGRNPCSLRASDVRTGTRAWNWETGTPSPRPSDFMLKQLSLVLISLREHPEFNHACAVPLRPET